MNNNFVRVQSIATNPRRIVEQSAPAGRRAAVKLLLMMV